MRSPFVALSLATAVLAQAPAVDVPAAMERLADATMSLQRAVDAGDRAAFAAPLARLTEQVRLLRTTPTPPDARAGLQDQRIAALDALGKAIEDLQHPIGDGRASDRWDLDCLRRACTSCHLATRDANADRGLFPNQRNAVFGTLRLEEQNGKVRSDSAGVVLFLEAPGLVAAPLPRPPSISQQGRRFHPSVLAVTTGTTVRFPNDDVVFHNVFSLSRSNPFDLGSYGKGQSRDLVLGNPGLVKVHCNIHPDMVAHVLVLDSAFSAVTTTTGFWAIPDVPDGDYTLRVWHPLAEEQRQPLQVTGGGGVEVPLTLRETKPRVQHANKHGRAYPEKY